LQNAAASKRLAKLKQSECIYVTTRRYVSVPNLDHIHDDFTEHCYNDSINIPLEIQV